MVCLSLQKTIQLQRFHPNLFGLEHLWILEILDSRWGLNMANTVDEINHLRHDALWRSTFMLYHAPLVKDQCHFLDSQPCLSYWVTRVLSISIHMTWNVIPTNFCLFTWSKVPITFIKAQLCFNGIFSSKSNVVWRRETHFLIL